MFLHVTQFFIISGTNKNYFKNDAKAVAGRNLGKDSVQSLEGTQYSNPNFFKGMLLISPQAEEILILKKEMPFNVTSEGNTKTVSYMTKMQSIGL
jgi:hypothetical protein